MTAAADRVTPADAGPRTPPGAIEAARAADEKLGEHTVVLAMGELLGVTDAFVITNGRNTRQVRTIAEEVERRVKERCGRAPLAIEGLRDLHWVLMDYGDFLVHVFLDETRAYYDLERLWGDAPRVDWASAASARTAGN
jgi:ribosome-associated protein